MHLELLRICTKDDATLGAIYIDGTFECFTVEDGWNANKVAGETRIHPGLYDVGVRETGGTFNPKYADRYSFHRGMLHILDTPEFEWVYFHTGNTKDHTQGCILLNDSIHNNGTGSASRQAYTDFYPKVIAFALAERLTLRIRDYA
jgi:hypothetical protein